MYNKDFLRSDFYAENGVDCNLDKGGYIDYLEGRLCDPLQNTPSNSDYAKKCLELLEECYGWLQMRGGHDNLCEKIKKHFT